MVQTHRPGDVLVPPPSLPSVHINGRRVSYASMGLDNDPDKPAIVLLHGFGGFFMDWPRVMAPLSRHTRVYAMDLPGWGFSEINRQARSLEDDVQAVEDFIRALDLKRVILCGISYGAGLAWAAAAMGMSRVERVVLLNPMPTNPLEFMTSAIYKGIFLLNLSPASAFLGHKLMTKSQYKVICRENLLNHRLLDTFYLDLAYLVMKQPSMPFLLHLHSRGARELDWADWEHRLAGARTPVTILHGLNDRIFPREASQHLHDLIPHSKLIEVPDCGHAMVFDQHKKVSDHVLSVWNECVERTSDRDTKVRETS